MTSLNYNNFDYIINILVITLQFHYFLLFRNYFIRTKVYQIIMQYYLVRHKAYKFIIYYNIKKYIFKLIKIIDSKGIFSNMEIMYQLHKIIFVIYFFTYHFNN